MNKLILIIAVCLSCSFASAQDNWTRFRGSNLNAVATGDNYPVGWNDSLNLAWKTAIHGRGWSSPVMDDNKIWLTTAAKDGKTMSLLSIDFHTGKILFDEVIFTNDTTYRIHPVNSYATPTPCIDSGLVFANFGRYGTACYKTSDYSLVWKRTDFRCMHVQGPGSSPIVHGEKLILHFEGTDRQYIVALNKYNGELIWEVDRPKELYDSLLEIGKKAYITPIVIQVGEKELLISNGSAVCIAYDVETGEEVWRIPQGEDSTIAMPVYADGILSFYTGFVTDENDKKYCELLAVDPEGKGNIASTNILWRLKSPILQLSTQLAINGLIYTINSASELQCIEALTGELVWTEKLKGKFNSSPVYANGKIYFSSTHGETYVYEAGRKKKLLAVNSNTGEIWATPAFTNESILLRTSDFLYKIKE